MKDIAIVIITVICMGIIFMSYTFLKEPNLLISETDYKGHHYIIFREKLNYGQTYVHDPDCPCHKPK